MRVFLLLCTILSTAGVTWAAVDTVESLATELQNGLSGAANGNVEDGFSVIYRHERSSLSPKERSEALKGARAMLSGATDHFGPSTAFHRLTFIPFGPDYYRLRLLDRRPKGLILYTFILERSNNGWVIARYFAAQLEDSAELWSEIDPHDLKKTAPTELDSAAAPLVETLASAVQAFSAGNPGEGNRRLQSVARTKLAGKERLARTEEMQSLLDSARDLGASISVNQTHLATLGDQFFEIRYLDRKDQGALTWAFIGEKTSDGWLLSSTRLYGSDDLLKLFRDQPPERRRDPAP